MPSELIVPVPRSMSLYRTGYHALLCLTLLCAGFTALTAQTPGSEESPRPDVAQMDVIPASSAQGERSLHISFNRYRAASACVGATNREELLYWRARRMDSIAPVTRNRWQDPSLAAAKACAQQFPLDSVPVHELLAMSELLLVTGDEAGFTTIAKRYLEAGDASSRAFRLYQIILKLVLARPARTDLAFQYARQLDSLGPALAGWRLAAYTILATRISFDWDVPQLTDAVQRGLEAFAQLPDSSRLQWAQEIAQLASVHAQLASEGPGGVTEAVDIMTRFNRILAPIRPDLARGLSSTTNYTSRGKFAERVEGMWANVAAGDTIRPRPGQMSLLVFTSHRCSWLCYPGQGVLRRLTADYFGNDSSAITLVLRGEGMFRLQGTSISPEEELQKAAAQYVTDEHIRAGIVMSKAPLEQIADGRYFTRPSVNETRYNLPNSAFLGVLVDRDGNIYRVAPINPEHEGYWNAILTAMKDVQAHETTDRVANPKTQ